MKQKRMQVWLRKYSVYVDIFFSKSQGWRIKQGRNESENKIMKINANMSALVTNKRLHHVENTLQASMERLSSGLKLNHAKDNPAGMAISNKMKSQIAGLDRASNNASDAIAAVRIADGALNEVSSMMQRMRELAVQAANDTNSLEDRQAIQQEIDALKEEVNRISRDTEYNEMPILDGSLSARVYTEHVTRVSTTDTVAPGDYKLTIDEKAKKAEIEIDARIKSTDTTNKVGVDGTLSVNGYSVKINADDTFSEVYGKLRDAAEVGNAELVEKNENNTTSLVLVSNDYGSTASLKLGFSSEEMAKALGFVTEEDADPNAGITAEVTKNSKTGEIVYGTEKADGTWDLPHGEDVKVTLNKTAAESSFSQTATATADGNRVKIKDKTGFEISFLVDEGYAGEVNLEVTDIGTMTIHIGANEDQNMTISVPEVSSESLYIDDIDVTVMGGAGKAIARIDEALMAVSSARSKFGAYENRLDYTVASLDAFEENMTGAQSRLADTDMAEEMTIYTQQNVLNQAAISVLTQANDMPQQVLQLLQ